MNKERSGLFVIVAVAFVASLWLLNWFLLHGDEDRGTWGDMFGGINALFSGLAFVGLIYAVLLQRQELGLQREELVQTRVELRGQREANEKQNDFLEKQIFESSLFQMVRTLEKVLDAIDRRNNDGGLVSKGRDTIRSLYNDLRTGYVSLRSRDAHISNPEPSQSDFNPTLAYDQFYQEYGDEIGHYFRVLYNIFKFIDRSAISDKSIYTNLVRAQMSDYEAALLFYNALTPRGARFRTYIDKYHLLKFARPELLLSRSHVSLHNPSAYGANS